MEFARMLVLLFSGTRAAIGAGFGTAAAGDGKGFILAGLIKLIHKQSIRECG
jgi:hypothetical protein